MRTMGNNDWILIPAHNESASLRSVICEIRRQTHCQILVVNSCSTDDTATIAKQYADCVVSAGKIGYWNAIQCGYQYLLEHSRVERLVQLDADGQHEALHIPRLFFHLGYEPTPIWVWGSRYQSGSVSDGALSIGQHIFSRFASRYAAKPLYDVSSGFWAVNKSTIEAFVQYKPSNHTADVVLRLFAIKHGVRCVEIPMAMNPRLTGESMHAGMINRVRYLRSVALDAYGLHKQCSR